MTDRASVVEIPTEPPVQPPPSPPSRVHGFAIAGMAFSALLGIVSMLAFITVNWPGQTARYIVGAFVLAGIGFLACASAAVLTAARDTYAVNKSEDG